MSEVRVILQQWKKAPDSSYAMATVVRVVGSSYRKPGARMLIDQTGHSVGAISGGCLEDDVRRQAVRSIAMGKARLLAYETTDEDVEGTKKIKLGCNGKIYILIEPILCGDHSIFHLLQTIVDQGKPAVLRSTFHSEAGSMVSDLTHDVFWPDDASKTEDEKVQPTLDTERSQVLEADDGQVSFYDFIEPPISLCIVGSGYDVAPLVQIADVLGWTSTIISRRAKHLDTIPSTASRITCSEPSELFDQFIPSYRTAFVLMSHNYMYDKNFLHALLQYDIPYIGMLGPKSKFQKIKREWREEGIKIDAKRLDSVHSPIGLDIGSKRAEEIALAISSQILSAFQG